MYGILYLDLDYRDHRSNKLSFKEKLALKELKQSDEIVLKPANKGGLNYDYVQTDV